MQVSVESPTTVERRLTVVVPSADVEKAFDSQLVTFAQKAELKGFRRGKVPLTYVKQRFAKEIREETISHLIQESLSEAIHQEKLSPITAPRVETTCVAPSLEYVATFDVLPEIGPIHFKVDNLEKPTAAITEQDIDKTIERLCGGLSELSTDDVKKFGIESGDIQDLRAEIRQQLEFNLKRTEKRLLRDRVFEKLMEQNPVDLPSSLVVHEARRLHDDNCTAEHGHHSHSQEDEAHIREMARKRIHLGLLVGEYATKNQISPSSERINEYITGLSSFYTDPEKYSQQIKADRRSLKEVEAAVLEEVVVEKLLENISLEEKAVSYEELIKMQ